MELMEMIRDMNWGCHFGVVISMSLNIYIAYTLQLSDRFSQPPTLEVVNDLSVLVEELVDVVTVRKRVKRDFSNPIHFSPPSGRRR